MHRYKFASKNLEESCLCRCRCRYVCVSSYSSATRVASTREWLKPLLRFSMGWMHVIGWLFISYFTLDNFQKNRRGLRAEEDPHVFHVHRLFTDRATRSQILVGSLCERSSWNVWRCSFAWVLYTGLLVENNHTRMRISKLPLAALVISRKVIAEAVARH